MLKNEYLKQWSRTISQRMPHLSIPEAIGLATWSFGIVMTKSSSLNKVSEFIAQLNGEKTNTVRQRLKEWYQDALSKTGVKQGKKRAQLEVSSCFAPLLKWIVSLLPTHRQQLTLALDATNIKNNFTVLSINVLIAGCAVPVAWCVVKAAAKESWKPIWQELLTHLQGVIPNDWTVIVCADRVLYTDWLYKMIVQVGWHPFLRINHSIYYNGGLCVPTEEPASCTDELQGRKPASQTMPYGHDATRKSCAPTHSRSVSVGVAAQQELALNSTAGSQLNVYSALTEGSPCCGDWGWGFLPNPNGQLLLEGNLPEECILLACWDIDSCEPWLILTDLEPADTSLWHELRSWTECCYQDVKTDDWQWRTRLTDCERAQRMWLAIALAKLWMVMIGSSCKKYTPVRVSILEQSTHSELRRCNNYTTLYRLQSIVDDTSPEGQTYAIEL